MPESIYFDYNKDHCGDIPTTGNLDSISDCMGLPSGLDAYLWISGLRNPEALRVAGVTYLAIQICDDFNINDSDSENEQSFPWTAPVLSAQSASPDLGPRFSWELTQIFSWTASELFA